MREKGRVEREIRHQVKEREKERERERKKVKYVERGCAISVSGIVDVSA